MSIALCEATDAEQLTFTSISAAYDGTVWGVNDIGIYEYQRATNSWEIRPTTISLKRVAAGSATSVFGMGQDGSSYRYDPASAGWQPLKGLVRCVDIAANNRGMAWCIDSKGHIYYLTVEFVWQPAKLDAPVTLMQLSVGAGNLWGLSEDGRVYHYDEQAWSEIPTDQTFVHISAGSLRVWAVDGNNNVYVYVGEPEFWYQAQGQFTQISAGSEKNIWGIAPDGHAVDLSQALQGGSMEGTIRPLPGAPEWDTEDPFNENKSTHLWIVNRAAILAQQNTPHGESFYKLFGPDPARTTRTGRPFHDQLCQGLYDADFLPQYNNPEFGQATWASHFYDPSTGKNWRGKKSPTALSNGVFFFSAARDAHVHRNQANAGYNLGLALHYFTDLTQPMHASNFTYLSSILWGYHTAFEEWTLNEVQKSISAPKAYRPSRLGIYPGPYLINAATISKKKLPQIAQYRWTHYYPASNFRPEVRPAMDALLQDAISLTAQFMVAWMYSATSLPFTHRMFPLTVGGDNAFNSATPTTGKYQIWSVNGSFRPEMRQSGAMPKGTSSFLPFDISNEQAFMSIAPPSDRAELFTINDDYILERRGIGPQSFAKYHAPVLTYTDPGLMVMLAYSEGSGNASVYTIDADYQLVLRTLSQPFGAFKNTAFYAFRQGEERAFLALHRSYGTAEFWTIDVEHDYRLERRGEARGFVHTKFLPVEIQGLPGFMSIGVGSLRLWSVNADFVFDPQQIVGDAAVFLNSSAIRPLPGGIGNSQAFAVFTDQSLAVVTLEAVSGGAYTITVNDCVDIAIPPNEIHVFEQDELRAVFLGNTATGEGEIYSVDAYGQISPRWVGV